ncbi:ATP-binding protein [Chloroflexota bacterium]
MTLYQIIPLIQGAVTFFLVALVLRQGVKNAATRLFSAFLIGMSLWGVFIGVMRIMPPESAVLWEKLALTMIGFTAVFFYLFSGEYINSRSRLGTYFCMLYLVLTAAIMPTRLLVEGMGIDEYGNAPIWGLSFYPWLLIGYILIIVSMVKLNKARQVSFSYEERNRYLFFIIGIGFSLVGGVFDILPALGVPVLPGSIIGNMMFAGLTAWAISRYHLFDIRIMVRISLAYMITGIILLLPLGGFAGLWLRMSEYWKLSFIETFLPLLLLLLLAPPIWGKITPLISSLILRERYSHLKSLDEFSSLSVKPDNPSDLYSSLVDLTRTAVNPSCIFLFTRTDDEDFRLETHLGTQLEIDLHIPREHPLVSWLEKEKRMLTSLRIETEPLLQSMSDSDRTLVDQIGGELFCPMGIVDLLAIMIVGPKSHVQLYTRDDINFLRAIARQASLELENIGLFNRERAQRKRLEQFNMERAAFLDALAHELKTPLTSAVSSSELLLHQSKDLPEDLQPFSSDVYSSIRDLERVVNDILDFGDRQSTQMKFYKKRTDLRQIGLSMKDECSVIAKNREQNLIVTLPDNPLWVNIDPARMRQVLRNLIGNACKFSPSGCNIFLRMMELDRSIRIEVQDSADPIDPDDRENLFTPYFRGMEAQAKKIPGLGLGLFISRQLVEGQGGKLLLIPGRENGNIFCVVLPKERVMS